MSLTSQQRQTVSILIPSPWWLQGVDSVGSVLGSKKLKPREVRWFSKGTLSREDVVRADADLRTSTSATSIAPGGLLGHVLWLYIFP